MLTFKSALALTELKKTNKQTKALAPYRVSHVGLEVKPSWGAEDVVVGLHQFLFVSVGLQTLCSSLQCLQAGVFGRFNVLFR